MTREEAKKEMLNITGSIYTETDELEDLIDKIYDDFENRICQSCKFYKVEEIDSEDEMRDVMTGCSQFYMETNYAYDFKNFGCNRWERKDDK